MAALLTLAAGCSRKPMQNYRSCLKLRVGLERPKLLERMGPPDETQPYMEGRSLPHMKGRTAYEWATPASMPAPNRVVVDDLTDQVESIRCGDSSVTAAALPEPAPGAANEAGTSLFVGHYGYALRHPAGHEARPSFTPPDNVGEKVAVGPAVPCARTPEDCALDGFVLLVLPKWSVAKLGHGSFDGYVAKIAAAVRADGQEPDEPSKRPGRLPAWTFTRRKPRSLLDATVFVEGAKVYYIFDHRAGSPVAAAAIDSLAEQGAHDRPPAGAAPARALNEPASGVRSAGRPISDAVADAAPAAAIRKCSPARRARSSSR